MAGEAGSIPGTGLVGGVLASVSLVVAAWGAGRVAPGAQAGADPWPDARLDVNTAPAEQLCVLPGVGTGLAERIVADRAGRGPFARLEELDRVHGIGPATLERLRPWAVAE